MKVSILVTLAFLANIALTQVVQAAVETDATVNTYTATSRFEHPLNTFERCGAGTFAGQAAEAVAEREAFLQCRQGFNADCILVGSDYRTFISQDFMGYKACEATVTVHGYRLN